MQHPSPSSIEFPHGTLLHQANEALQRGDVDFSQTLAKRALLHAKRLGDTGGEASALLALAKGDLQMSRLRRSRSFTEQAVKLFRSDLNAGGEAVAFINLSHVLSYTGHSSRGVDAGQQALHLSSGVNSATQAFAQNCLGVAYTNGQRFDKAADVFSTSIHLFESNGLWAESLLPRFHIRASEIYRCFSDRYCQGDFLSLELLQRLQYQDFIAVAETKSQGQINSSHNATLALLEITQGFERCWLGDLDGAAECADRVCSDPKRGADQAMVRLFEIWLRAEIAWSLEDWSIAEAHAQRLQLLSLRFENEHLRAVAYLLQAQIYAAQGKDGLAQTQLRLMKAHEAELRNENLNDSDELLARGTPVVTAVKTNGVGQHSAFINPFAMQDSLTGMKNRRYLEQIAPGLIARSTERNIAPVMIFIDVNRFQGINERHSPNVGDAVLKTLARILESTVPNSDLLARLGGDEFVMVLAPPSVFELRALLQQVRDQVSGYEWAQVCPGLNVSVSCVSAVAEPQDTFDSWLHRCELSMCLEKHSQELKFS